jgi:hypothetical protein
MADNIVGTKIVIDSDQAVKSVGSIKAQLREATNELVSLAAKFGEGSQEAVNAAKKVAELRDRIGDAKSMVDAFNPDAKFKAVSQSIQGVAGAFAAVQGAMATFGIESEDLQKQLLKVQGALALSEGLNTFLDTGIQGLKNLKTVAIDAFKGIKAAIGSTGIGLLVVALGTIVAYWDDIKHAVSGVSKAQEDLTEKTKKTSEAEKEKLDSLNSQDNILKLQGKSEKEILGIKIKQTDQVIAAMEAQLKSQVALENSQIQAAQRNKEILEGFLKFITIPIDVLLKGIDMAGKAFGKDFGLEKGFYGGIAGLVFDPKDIKDKGDKANKELEKQIIALRNTQAGYKLSLQQADKKPGETKKADGTIKNVEIDTIDSIGLAYKKLDLVREQSTLKNQQLTDKNIGLAYAEAEARKQAYSDIGQALGTLAGVAEQGSDLQKGLALAQIAIDTGIAISNLTATSSAPTPDNLATGGLSGFAKYAVGIAKIIANIAAARNIIKGANANSSGGGNPSQSGMTAPVAPTSQIQQTITSLNQGTINALGNQAIKAYVLESDVTNSQGRVTRILNSSRFK